MIRYVLFMLVRKMANAEFIPVVPEAEELLDNIHDRLSEAASRYELADTSDWDPMAELSSATQLDGLSVDGLSTVKVGDGEFVAPAFVYVTLQYDPNSDDPVVFSDSYPARVFFRILGGAGTDEIKIEKIHIDNSSFFE